MYKYIKKAEIVEKITAAEMQKELKAMSGEKAYNAIIFMINEVPAADVVEVKHGKWIRYHEADFGWDEWGYRCSNCEWEVEDRDIKFPMNFCPCCGAKMDGERRSDNGENS